MEVRMKEGGAKSRWMFWSMEMVTVVLLLLLCSRSNGVWATRSRVKAGYFYYGGGIQASDVNARLFTHILYAFAFMDPSSYNVTLYPDDTISSISNFSATIKRSNPSAKTLLSIGGGSSNSSSFAAMASSASSRSAFIRSSIEAASRWGFDGLDLDWEFPHSSAEMEDFADLCREWRAAAGSRLLLTAAVYYNVTMRLDGRGARNYPASAIGDNLDFVTVMSYDLHGAWDTTQTAEHTALYDNTTEQILTVNYGIRNWLAAGLPAARLAMGLAAYGRLWYLQNPAEYGVGAPATPESSTLVPLTFTEIQDAVAANNGKCGVDNVTVSAYCYWATADGTVWAGFDDTTTIASKVRYLKSLHLRGYSFWSLAGDTKSLLFRRAATTL